jgi:hypothetical protein
MEWALREGSVRDAPPVLLGVPRRLLAAGSLAADAAPDAAPPGAAADDAADDDKHAAASAVALATKHVSLDGGCALLPPPSSEVTAVRLPASLLQKGLRRGFCSAAPVLEACAALLRGTGERPSPPRGGTYAMLSTTWGWCEQRAST